MGWDVHLEFLLKVLKGAGTTYPWYFNSSIYILTEHLRLLALEQHPSGVLGPILGGVNTVIKLAIVVMFVMFIMKSRSQLWTHSGRSSTESTDSSWQPEATIARRQVATGSKSRPEPFVFRGGTRSLINESRPSWR